MNSVSGNRPGKPGEAPRQRAGIEDSIQAGAFADGEGVVAQQVSSGIHVNTGCRTQDRCARLLMISPVITIITNCSRDVSLQGKY